MREGQVCVRRFDAWQMVDACLSDGPAIFTRRALAGQSTEVGLGPVCEVFFWRYAIPLFTVTYEPYTKGD
jgi:hypothetical protein